MTEGGGGYRIGEDDPRYESSPPESSPSDTAAQAEPGVTKSLYLVYSIEPDSQPVGEWLGKRTDVAFIPSPKGAYFAESKEQACGLAALRYGKAGTYVAVETEAQKITASSTAMIEEEIEELERRNRKELKRQHRGRG
jgi:hypothetical protein